MGNRCREVHINNGARDISSNSRRLRFHRKLLPAWRRRRSCCTRWRLFAYGQNNQSTPISRDEYADNKFFSRVRTLLMRNTHSCCCVLRSACSICHHGWNACPIMCIVSDSEIKYLVFMKVAVTPIIKDDTLYIQSTKHIVGIYFWNKRVHPCSLKKMFILRNIRHKNMVLAQLVLVAGAASFHELLARHKNIKKLQNINFQWNTLH